MTLSRVCHIYFQRKEEKNRKFLQQILLSRRDTKKERESFSETNEARPFPGNNHTDVEKKQERPENGPG